jgi:hypothetical protein
MGLIGSQIGGYAGSGLGEFLGKKYGGSIGQEAGKNIGRVAGTAAGALLPFQKGGKVKKTGPALLHKGEIVVPAKYAKDVSKSLKDKIKKNGGHNM